MASRGLRWAHVGARIGVARAITGAHGAAVIPTLVAAVGAAVVAPWGRLALRCALIVAARGAAEGGAAVVTAIVADITLAVIIAAGITLARIAARVLTVAMWAAFVTGRAVLPFPTGGIALTRAVAMGRSLRVVRARRAFVMTSVGSRRRGLTGTRSRFVTGLGGLGGRHALAWGGAAHGGLAEGVGARGGVSLGGRAQAQFFTFGHIRFLPERQRPRRKSASSSRRVSWRQVGRPLFALVAESFNCFFF